MAILNDDMIKEIKKYCGRYDREYSEIKNNDDIIKIYNLLICDIMSPINDDDNNYFFRYYGLYYGIKAESTSSKEPSKIIEYNHIAEKYYLTALERGNIEVTNDLGDISYINDKHDIANKYYLIGAENGNTLAMFNLGFYYQYIEKKYELMKKYYLMAIENGSGSGFTETLAEFGNYYREIEENYTLAIKYYLRLENIKNSDNYTNMLNVLECCRSGRDYNELIMYIIKYNKYDIINRFQLHGVFLNHTFTTEQIETIIDKTDEELIDAPSMLKLLKKTLHTKVDIMDLHYKYSTKGEGFKEAKTDFINKLNIPKK